MRTVDEQSMTLLCRQKKKKSFPVYVHHYYPPLEEVKGKKEKAAGRWKKGKSRSRTKRWESALKQTYNRFSTNCDQMSFFDKKGAKGAKKKNKISIVFETNIIKQTSGVTMRCSVRSEQIYTDGDDYDRPFSLSLSPTFNISLNIRAH